VPTPAWGEASVGQTGLAQKAISPSAAQMGLHLLENTNARDNK
jgi:hypothetical protein